MKHATLSPLLLASALFASSAFAQEQAAPPAAEAADEATVEAAAEAPVEATAEAPVEAADPTVEAGTEAAVEAAAPATDVAVAQATATELNPQVKGAIGDAQEGKAQIVFFRPSKFTGGAIKFKVRENGTELGQLASGRYFVRHMEPGAHAFTVHSEAKDVINLEVEAGQTYFVAGTISMGVMVGRPNLAPSDATAFEAALKKMKKLEVAE